MENRMSNVLQIFGLEDKVVTCQAKNEDDSFMRRNYIFTFVNAPRHATNRLLTIRLATKPCLQFKTLRSLRL